MKVVVIGCMGRMGKKVCELLESDSKFDQFVGIDSDEQGNVKNCFYNQKTDEFDLFCKADVVIDFSTCSNRKQYFEQAKKNKIPYALFSTNLSEQDKEGLTELSKIVPVLKCSNSSIGIKAIKHAVENICSDLPECDVVINEYHHKSKKDSPSGTANLIASWIKKFHKFNLQINSNRVGNEVGMHKIEFFLEDEMIEISHSAKSRTIFARGAIELSKRLILRPVGLYEE